MNQRGTLYLVWLFATIGIIEVIICCVSTYWIVKDTTEGKLHLGLWANCVGLNICNSTSVRLVKSENDLNVIQGLMVIGIILMFFTNIVNIVAICGLKRLSIFLVVLKVLAFCCIGGSLGYTTFRMKIIKARWSWGFMIGWAGLGVEAISFVFLCIAMSL